MHKQLWTALKAELELSGCTPRAQGFATKPIFPGLDTWIAMASRKSAGTILLAPMIGIRCHAVHRIVSYLYEEEWAKYHPYLPSTASCSIGYLMDCHEYLELSAHPEDDPEAIAKNAMSPLLEFGIPQTGSIRDIGEISDFVVDHAIPTDRIQRLCIIIYLAGEGWPEVKAFLESLSPDELDEHQDFITRFRAFMDANPVPKPLSEYV